MNDRMKDLDVFIQTVQELEDKVVELIQKTNLTQQEKMFILDHILVIPGIDEGKN